MTYYWLFFLFSDLKLHPIIRYDYFSSLLSNDKIAEKPKSNMMILKGLLVTGVLADVTSTLVSSSAPEWALILREFGSFGLIAFIVYWYATHVAPSSQKQYLDSAAQMKSEFMEHNRMQRQEATETIKTIQVDVSKQLDRQRGDYLDALKSERATYVESVERQRLDFIKMREEDRALTERFINTAENLFRAVREHMSEARIVWQERGELPKEVRKSVDKERDKSREYQE